MPPKKRNGGNGNNPSRPSSASSNASGGSRKGQKLEWGLRPDVGPRPNEAICISEEVKIGINLAVERFRLNETQKELEFPTSLTATERAYIHRLGDDFGLKHRSKGKGATRYLVLSKKDENSSGSGKSIHFEIIRNSKSHIASLLQRFPLSSKERLELLPNLDKNQVNEVSKELARTATGRLNNGVPQVPPGRGNSDLRNFTSSLPINQYRNMILKTIHENQVCLISGETGSGKTTQVPQMILDDCHATNKPCRIFCTQPRRIAALSISERVATERGENVGQTVGFQIRLESRVSPKTLLTFCTNGVLLRTLMGSEDALNTVTHVIVDEVHERDKFSDFLLVCLRAVSRRNPNLKVILMSATLNIDLFVKYFGSCPVVSVPGSLFPVEEYFLEDILKWTGYTNKKMEKYQKELEQMTVKTQQLAEWCNQDPDKIDPRLLSKRKYKHEDDNIDKDPDDRSLLTDQLSKLGMYEEKDELEPWVIQEMDQYLSEIWLTGNEDLFPQVFHLIKSENVSVDYQHSETTVTALMIAAGRGFTDIVEQLLTMGADPTIKSSNYWSSIDWARKFNQEETVALLEAEMSSSKQSGETENYIDDDNSNLSDKDKQRLFIYQHCWDDDVVDIQLITTLLYFIVTTQPEGSVLIFLPGYHEIVSLRDMIDADEQFARIRYTLFQLHSSMQSTDQKKVFKPSPPGIRKIILATNIAETSITINDVGYVINSGKVKEKTFDSLLKITMLKSNWISKASVAQRRGRAGRVRKGVCYNMFSKTRYNHLLDYAIPELLRCPLQEICLQTKLLAPLNQSILDFLSEAPEPPPFMVVRSAISVLKEMDALDQSEEMTELGRHLADLPVEPHLGKMVLYSIVLKCVDPVLTVVCSLSYKDPFLIPNQPSEKRMLATIKQNFSADTYSDHMTLLRLFQAWQKARSEGWERQFCSRNFISPAVMEMIVGMRAQLLGQLRASGFVRARGGGDIRDLNTNSENWAVVKAALFAGGYPNVIRWDRNSWKFVSKSGEKIKIHISSVLPQKPGGLPSDWVFYEEMTRSNQGQHGGMACIRCCTILSPLTVAMFAGPAKLPADALKDSPETDLDDGVLTSDSENEDPEDYKCSTLQLVDWLSFKLDAETADLVLQLRQKWHCLFLRRMRAPAKPWTPMDEAVIMAVVNVLTNEEQALGLQQPAGIGQRPRPMSAESIMSGSYNGRGTKYHDEIEDTTKHRFSTSAKKATSTPPKRKDFMSPKMRSSDSSSQNSPSLSHHSSEECSPYHSPQIDHSSTGVRYFIMKCSSQRNIDISVNKGAWATSKTNEQKLNKAFLSGDTVYLIYSIQGSGHFQGYATMSSCIGTDKSSDYNGQGGVFSVDWIKRGNIKFQCTHHLLNPWNEGKRVQVSRDGQEIEPKIGEALISLWDSYPDNDGDREPRWSNTGHASEAWTNRQQMFVTDSSGDGYHDNRSFSYQNQQQQQQQPYSTQYNQPERYYTQQTYNPHFQSWGNQGAQRFQYNQRGRQAHYQGFGNYGYQGHDQGHQYVESGSQYHRDSPVMILQRDQRQSAFPKHKK